VPKLYTLTAKISIIVYYNLFEFGVENRLEKN